MFYDKVLTTANLQLVPGLHIDHNAQGSLHLCNIFSAKLCALTCKTRGNIWKNDGMDGIECILHLIPRTLESFQLFLLFFPSNCCNCYIIKWQCCFCGSPAYRSCGILRQATLRALLLSILQVLMHLMQPWKQWMGNTSATDQSQFPTLLRKNQKERGMDRQQVSNRWWQ